MDPLPELALRAFERATGLTVCVNDHDGTMAHTMPAGRFGHQGAYCAEAKLMRNAACRDFDLTTVAAELSRQPFARVKRCHAGIIEWIAPVCHDGHIAAVLFAGQRAGQAPAGALLQPLLPGSRSRLPAVSTEDSGWYCELLSQLAARLSMWLAEHIHAPSARTRTEVIRRFIAERHARGDGLAELSRLLHLSPQRTSHVVRELLGVSLRLSLDRARLESAARLLLSSDLSVAAIAKASGFADVSRFHRCFRRTHGLTPTAWRKRG